MNERVGMVINVQVHASIHLDIYKLSIINANGDSISRAVYNINNVDLCCMCFRREKDKCFFFIRFSFMSEAAKGYECSVS